MGESASPEFCNSSVGDATSQPELFPAPNDPPPVSRAALEEGATAGGGRFAGTPCCFVPNGISDLPVRTPPGVNTPVGPSLWTSSVCSFEADGGGPRMCNVGERARRLGDRLREEALRFFERRIRFIEAGFGICWARVDHTPGRTECVRL